jgi:N-acetylneuraminic acid mutarotase
MYVPATDTWTQKSDFPGGKRIATTAFSIGNYGYTGAGYSGEYKSDLWKYNKNTNTWTAVNDIPSAAKCYITSFVVKNKAYALGGWDGSSSSKELYEYDPIKDSWTKMYVPADFSARSAAVYMVFGNVVYFGLGNENLSSTFRDLWKIDFGN